MKGKIIAGIVVSLGLGMSVYAASRNFNIDTSSFSFSSQSSSTITDNFNLEYNIEYYLEDENEELKDEITTLSKKVTYLLFGQMGQTEESSEDYYNRHKEYLTLRYDPEVPADETTFTGLDEDSQEYLDDLVSGISVPGMFLMIKELEIEYNSIDSIRVNISDNCIIACVYLPNVTMKEENDENPMEYDTVRTNLTMYYYFKELNGEYKLYYLFGETDDALDEYFESIDEGESTSSMNIAPISGEDLSDIYDFSALSNLTQDRLNTIYEENKNSIFKVEAYYLNSVVASANAFAINDGIIVTTWNFMENALANAQFITITGLDKKTYEIDGIVTASIENDVVVIKLKEKNGSSVNLSTDDAKVEDAAITITSKTGTSSTIQTGIIVSTDGYIQTTIPLLTENEGSILLNDEGQVIGMNTAKSTSSSLSLAVNTDVLSNIQEKFDSIDFDSIETISFDTLKEKYYYTNVTDETAIDSVSDSIWKKYSKVGNIEENINLELLKASYSDNILSLRYSNVLSDYISGIDLVSSYTNELLKEGYTCSFDSTNKQIYENGKYKVILMNEFDYLILVVMKL